MDQIEQAYQTLKEGKLILFPSYVGYMVGALGTHEQAIKKIFEIKEREENKPISLFTTGQEIRDFAIVPPLLDSFVDKLQEEKIMIAIMLERKNHPFFSGFSPYTLARVSKTDNTSRFMLSSGKYGELLALKAHQDGTFLIATSANVSGQGNERYFKSIEEKIKNNVDYHIIDDTLGLKPVTGPEEETEHATIFDLTKSEPEVLRKGVNYNKFDDYIEPAEIKKQERTITVLPGDGVGPEIITEAVKVLQKIEQKFGHTFKLKIGLIGGAAINEVGTPFPDETKKLCLESDAILFGAIGDPKYDNDPTAKVRPEQGLLEMRKLLGLYANVRPIETFNTLLYKSPLKEEIVKGADFVVIRELIGGIYFGERGRNNNNQRAFDTSTYTVEEIRRVSTFAFDLAGKRKKKLTVVDKANVLETSRLWREVIQQMEKNYSDVEVEYMFIDNAAMQIIKHPTDFDVILTENMFGDILTDEASVITGSIGMLPSASIGEKTSVFEPIHGSYYKATGTNSANPIGTILSVAMMLEYSFGMEYECRLIKKAVESLINEGKGTKDISAGKAMSTSEVGDYIVEKI